MTYDRLISPPLPKHHRRGWKVPRLLQGRHVVGEDHGAAAEGHHGGQGLSFGQRHLGISGTAVAKMSVLGSGWFFDGIGT